MTTQTEDLRKNTGLFHWLNENFEKIFIVIGLLAIIVFVTMQTINRYFITQFIDSGGALVWTDEVSRFIFIWISYFALSVAIKKRSSIRVDILHDMMTTRWQNIFTSVVDFCFLLFTIVLTINGWAQIERLMNFPQQTAALQLPYIVPYMILPFGFGLMTIRVLQCLKQSLGDCGIKDGVIAFICFLLVWLPLYPVMTALYIPNLPVLYDYIPPLPVLFGYFLLLCLIGVPIAIALGLSALATIICADTLPIEYIAQIAFTSIDSVPIMAIPFFIAAGVFMGAGGLSARLLAFADEMLGGLYGGMALTAIATCMFFGAISGSGPATVAAIGALTIPAMVDRGYNKYFAAALVAAAGSIGVMIPPSTLL